MNKSKLASQIKYKTEHTNMYFMHTITIIIKYHTNLILCWTMHQIQICIFMVHILQNMLESMIN